MAKAPTTAPKGDIETADTATPPAEPTAPQTEGTGEGEPTPPVEQPAPPEPTAEDALQAADQKDWTSAIIVAAGSPVPENVRRPVIVVQGSERVPTSSDDKNAPGTHRNGSPPPLKEISYPDGADAYFKMDDEVDFGTGRTPVIRVGISKEVEQAGFPGFSDKPGYVHVGPNSAIFAAANYAYTLGAKRIEIIGLSPEEIENLRPWFAEVEDKVAITYGG